MSMRSKAARGVIAAAAWIALAGWSPEAHTREAFAAVPVETSPSQEVEPSTPVPPVPVPRTAPPRPAPNPSVSRGSQGIPALTGPVVDTAGILDDDDERVIESIAYDVRQKTSAVIAVLTVRTTAPLDDFTYGMDVVKAWQLGSAENDDGLLLLVAVDDHHARFFTGYGLEGVLPDGRLGAILDRHVIPHFRSDDYAGGVRAGMTEIARILTTEYDGKAWPAYHERGPSVGGSVFLLLFVFLLFMAMSGRGRRRYHPIFWGGGFGGPMGGGFGGGFGGGGGGFGGGFGGGGGGFGGGGAGRSW